MIVVMIMMLMMMVNVLDNNYGDDGCVVMEMMMR